MKRREFLIRSSKGLVATSAVLTAKMAIGEISCGLIAPNVQRCDVGIPTEIATVKAKDQHRSEWCWAASISMAFAIHGYDVPQERIVKEAWGADVNMPGSPGAILSSVNRVWVDEDGSRFKAFGDVYSSSIQTISQDLAARLPVLIGTMGHMMVLTHIAWIVNVYGQWQIVDATVRDPWPLNPSRRQLTPVEFVNTQVAVRIRTAPV